MVDTAEIAPPITTRLITKVDTQHPTLPPPPSPIGRLEGPPRPPRWPFWTLGSMLVVLGLIYGSLFLIHVPYATIAPGHANETTSLIAVDGADVYPPTGDVLYTTVSIRYSVQLWRAIQGWRDSNIDVPSMDQVTGGRSVSETSKVNQDLMKGSKDTAVLVALRYLGYPIVGHGALVVEIADNTDAVGKLDPGDVIAAVDGQPIEFGNDLRTVTTAHQVGDVVTLHIDPAADGKSARDVEVKLSADPDDATHSIIGVGIQDYNVELPFDVTLDTGRVGGPSAGLAFTLGIIGVLTPGELTGGQKIAVTGTIRSDATVGPVGGVAQKTEAVKRSGAKVFLVPGDEYEEATAHAGASLRVIQVDTLDQALAVLADLGGNAADLRTPVDAAAPD